LSELEASWKKIGEYYLCDESSCISELLHSIEIKPFDLQQIDFAARDLVEYARKKKSGRGTIEAFISEYNLSSTEGIVLMCLAEALLRIPDDVTADRLIQSKLSLAEFKTHLGGSHSLFVNASTWGLMLTGKLVSDEKATGFSDQFMHLMGRLGEPVIRNILRQAMKTMASQYVMGENIETALARGKKEMHENYRFSYDMLGESALCAEDASRYFQSYKEAIEKVALFTSNTIELDFSAESISVKLSALHSRYEVSQHQRVKNELLPDLLSLVQFAREKNVAITIDAEEADRLELSLLIFEKIILHDSLKDWNGFGLAVQAYQKRAMPVLQWLKLLASKAGKVIPVRLVKGAYWDTEIKRAQEQGLSGYPVFTQKINTDVSYIAGVTYLLKNSNAFYPQFATHNAHTLATICQLAGGNTDFEFQRLHGMGQNLHDQLIQKHASRVYSPVGQYQDLLPYLVRRLLENGANSSFVNRIEDVSVSIDDIVENPVDVLSDSAEFVNPKISLPENIFPDRRNSLGPNLSDITILEKLEKQIAAYKTKCWFNELDDKGADAGVSVSVSLSPFDPGHIVGYFTEETPAQLADILSDIHDNVSQWQRTPIEHRINLVSEFSKLLQVNRVELYALCVYEAGKTLTDAVSEIREAIDFCEYYIEQANLNLTNPVKLNGPVGEENSLFYHGRGLFVCISPWNFPIAIFVGQIVAALISGNVVVAKSSRKTSIISQRLLELFYQAGFPEDVCRLVKCSGAMINDVLLKDERVAGVAFTGSFDTAIKINVSLAQRYSPIASLIAETGGLNAMIVDSSALPEQVVKDVLRSAFYSAGQRCSALRVLIVQRDILDKIKTLLICAMDELVVGDPAQGDTDVPPVIDKASVKALKTYTQHFKNNGKLLHEVDISSCPSAGNFVSPTLLEIEKLAELKEEKFGPILHLLSYEAASLDELIDDINAMGYGLTLGIHSRVDDVIFHIANSVNVGNIYVNRNMVGAVVGVQPFGGEGYSGTGPKAGGPNYLQRFCTEKTMTINTSAIGGNADLLSMSAQ